MSKTIDTIEIRTLDEILEASNANAVFKDAVRDLAANEKIGHPAISANVGAPPVKVLRFVMKLLEAHPNLAIERVSVQAQSGCSDFRGKATIEPGAKTVEFVWDCAWRARSQGFKDPWGDPDQIKAAREFGYQCFERFDLK